MNPAYGPAESVPLQVGTHDGFHGQQAVVQHTTVTVPAPAPAEPPKDHILWSLICFLYSNPCCLGLIALVYSIKARDRKVLGDMQGAQTYGTTARQLNIAATIVASITFLIFLITIIALSVSAANAVNYGYRYRNTYGY